MESVKRKPHRLSGYDYSTPGAYFITICTNQRKHLFWTNTSAAITSAKDLPLSGLGTICNRLIQDIPVHYSTLQVDHYVIMPNHIHLLLQITESGGPSIPTVIQQLKRAISRQAGFSLWQKDYYDHVIRGYEDYQNTWNYIEGNPLKWQEDDLCVPF